MLRIGEWLRLNFASGADAERRSGGEIGQQVYSTLTRNKLSELPKVRTMRALAKASGRPLSEVYRVLGYTVLGPEAVSDDDARLGEFARMLPADVDLIDWDTQRSLLEHIHTLTRLARNARDARDDHPHLDRMTAAHASDDNHRAKHGVADHSGKPAANAGRPRQRRATTTASTAR